MTFFEEKLKILNEKLLKMALMVSEAVQNSILSLTKRDSQLAKKVIEEDKNINLMENEIDELCVNYIALYQPKATDLRFITTAMKINTDLERMGDLAVDISERAIELNEEPQIKPYVDIPRMCQIVQGMVKDSIKAFVEKDSNLAKEVVLRDDEVDELVVQIYNELLMFMVQDPKLIPRATKITFVSKYLERIADHSTNICEDVYWLVEGKVLKHQELKK
ncbi:MAG: phosphate signaling complex protein PhoU [Thermoanaerobaculia bacterium]